jgi:hypothetical protein
MVVLDASFPVRSLLKFANKRLAPTVSWHLRLALAREGRPCLDTGLKRYDHVFIHLMPTRRSGREFAIDDMSMPSDMSTIDKEIASVVAGIDADEGVLIWTFLSKPRMPDFARQLRRALRNTGVDPEATIRVDGEWRPRIVIDTFGRETATNAYRYCTNVLFAGCLELPRQTLAAQYVAETRDLTATVSSEDLDLMIRGEVYHRIYQAMSRAACREVWVDQEGRTQAKPTRIWLFSRHHQQIRQELGAMLPGARWKLWQPQHMGDVLAKEAAGAMRIREILENLDGNEITIRGLKTKDPGFFRALPRSTFQRARDEAIADAEWSLRGATLVRAKIEARGVR